MGRGSGFCRRLDTFARNLFPNYYLPLLPSHVISFRRYASRACITIFILRDIRDIRHIDTRSTTFLRLDETRGVPAK